MRPPGTNSSSCAEAGTARAGAGAGPHKPLMQHQQSLKAGTAGRTGAKIPAGAVKASTGAAAGTGGKTRTRIWAATQAETGWTAKSHEEAAGVGAGAPKNKTGSPFAAPAAGTETEAQAQTSQAAKSSTDAAGAGA